MKPQIDAVGYLTSNIEGMKLFFVEVLNFEVIFEMSGNYVEFAQEGTRFALSTHEVMKNATGNESYDQPKSGQVLELMFRCEDPTDLDNSFAGIVEKGAKPIKPPADMPWGQRTAFFADPDGNIHELFCDLQT